MKTMIELAAEREALNAEFSRAKAKWEAKVSAIEAEMRKAREATVTTKPGDVIETRCGSVKVTRVYVYSDDVSIYGCRKTPSGRWSTKELPLYDWDYLSMPS